MPTPPPSYKHVTYDGDEPVPEGFFDGTGAAPGTIGMAAEWHLRAGAAGDPSHQWRAGMMYLEGNGVPFNMASAARLFLHSAINEGDEVGQNVATLHLKRPAVPASEHLGLAEWIEQGPAKSSDAECMYRAGLMFHAGEAVQPDPEVALRFFREAAAEGHVPAMVALARARLNPDYGEPFPEESVEYLTEAAEAGHVEAMVTLGTLLKSGHFGPKDVEVGLRWIRVAAELGDPQALFEMGQAAADEDEDDEAVEYFKAALAGGLSGRIAAGCCLVLGMLYKKHDRREEAIDVLELGILAHTDGRLAVLDDPQLRDFLLADLDELWIREAISRADDENDEYDEAIAYAEAKRVWPPIPGTHCPLLLANLGVLYKNDGQTNKAIETWKAALAAHVPAKREPGDPEWEKYQALLVDVRAFLAKEDQSAHRLMEAHVKALDAKDKRCFIATACYGDTDHPDVNTLRAWRDHSLLPNPAGAAAVRIYYSVSPAASRWLQQSPRVTRVIRKLLLEPWVRHLAGKQKV